MGRKIPGKKHRGVNDPEKQRTERLAKVKDKINAAPLNPDDQQISKSLSNIIELKNKVKDGNFMKKRKNARDNNADSKKKQIRNFKSKPEKPIRKFERYPGESDREFKHRMNKICSDVIREAAFEDKFHVDIKRNEKGEVLAVEKRPKDELELLVKKLRKEKKGNKNNKKKKSKDGEQTPRLTKSQKWAIKQAEKKKKKISQQEEDFNSGPQRESFKFGEIVHAPPTLVAPSKVEKFQGASRPGQKPLLLKSMLIRKTSGNTSKQNIPKENIKKKSNKVAKTIDKKAKRKKLPHALRRQLDKQQTEIIESYRLLKAQKYSTM